jgi:hypothetical protein
VCGSVSCLLAASIVLGPRELICRSQSAQGPDKLRLCRDRLDATDRPRIRCSEKKGAQPPRARPGWRWASAVCRLCPPGRRRSVGQAA